LSNWANKQSPFKTCAGINFSFLIPLKFHKSQYARRKVKLEKAVDIYLEQQNFFHDSFFYFMEEISDKLA
jgi:hypothetical protein